MISYISGTIIDIQEKDITISVQGLGYKVYSTQKTIGSLQVGHSAELFCHLVVRETALDVYGFESKPQKEFFELLITISGIGPKSALGILDVADIETLKTAVISGDTSHLTRVSGIGKKNAEKIVLELSSKIDGLASEISESSSNDVDVLEALLSLGYTQSQARSALQSIPKEITDTQEKIKCALKEISQ